MSVAPMKQRSESGVGGPPSGRLLYVRDGGAAPTWDPFVDEIYGLQLIHKKSRRLGPLNPQEELREEVF